MVLGIISLPRSDFIIFEAIPLLNFELEKSKFGGLQVLASLVPS